MKRGFAVVAALGVLIGGAVVLNLGEAVPVSELRPARPSHRGVRQYPCPAPMHDNGLKTGLTSLALGHSGGAVPESHRSSLFVGPAKQKGRPPTHD